MITGIYDVVAVGGRWTTILAEFRRQRNEEQTMPPAFRVYHNTQSPSRCRVTVRSEGGGTTTFDISPVDLRYLRLQGAHVETEGAVLSYRPARQM